MCQKLPDIRNKIHQTYLKAENLLKDAERLFESENPDSLEGLIFPAVNELRYAGNHLIQALNESEFSSQMANYEKALRHCERSVYDIFDAEILFCIRKLDTFIDDYRMILIGEVIPDYQECCRQIDQIRLKRDRDAAPKNWENLESDLAGLQEIRQKFEVARPELNKKVQCTIRERRRFTLSIALTILGILVSVLLMMF